MIRVGIQTDPPPSSPINKAFTARSSQSATLRTEEGYADRADVEGVSRRCGRRCSGARACRTCRRRRLQSRFRRCSRKRRRSSGNELVHGATRRRARRTACGSSSTAPTDWLRLATKLAANQAPCAQYYVSIPPLAADKTTFRPDQPWRIRALGPNFHAVAEISYNGWGSWVAANGSTWYAAGVEARTANGRAGLRHRRGRHVGRERILVGRAHRHRRCTPEPPRPRPRPLRRGRRRAAGQGRRVRRRRRPVGVEPLDVQGHAPALVRGRRRSGPT